MARSSWTTAKAQSEQREDWAEWRRWLRLKKSVIPFFADLDSNEASAIPISGYLVKIVPREDKEERTVLPMVAEAGELPATSNARMWPKLPSPHSPSVIEIRPLTSHSTASQLPSSQLFEFPIRPSCGVNTTPISPSCCFHPHGSTMAPPNQTRRRKDDDAFPTQQLTVLGQSPSISAARSLTIAGASIEAEC